MTHGELFAGISGFGLGFSRAGIETLWHVEIDEKCQAVLRRHYPDTLLLSDVRNCGAHNLLPVDIISFGSPCQDLSIAGKRKGLIDGEKSNLFFEAIRIVDELKPTFGVWENVLGAFSTNSGRDFAAVLAAFQNIGARDIAWTCLDAQYFGVAQRRRRVFLVADFRRERAAQVLFEPESCERHSAPSRETGARVAAPLTRGSATGRGVNEPGRRREDDVNLVAPTLTERMGRYSSPDPATGRGTPIVVARPLAHSSTSDHYDESQQSYVVGFSRASHSLGAEELAEPITQRHGDPGCVAFVGMAQAGAGWAPPSYPTSEDLALPLDSTRAAAVSSARHGVRRLTPTECERLQGFPDGWTKYYPIGGQCAIIGSWLKHFVGLRDVIVQSLIERRVSASCTISVCGDVAVSICQSEKIAQPSSAVSVNGWLERVGLVDSVHDITSLGSDTVIPYSLNGTRLSVAQLLSVDDDITALQLKLSLEGHCNQENSSIILTWMKEMTPLLISSYVQTGLNMVVFTLRWNALRPNLSSEDLWCLKTANIKYQSDSARYRQLGNAVAVPVAQWIGERILAADNDNLARA